MGPSAWKLVDGVLFCLMPCVSMNIGAGPIGIAVIFLRIGRDHEDTGLGATFAFRKALKNLSCAARPFPRQHRRHYGIGFLDGVAPAAQAVDQCEP